MSPKKILKVEAFDDIRLIGINTTNRDYKLAWHINQALQIDLSKQDDIQVADADGQKHHFSFYYYYAGENLNTFNLVGNHSAERSFVGLKMKTDFFLIVRNPLTDAQLAVFTQKIKQIPNVLMAFNLEPSKHKEVDVMLEQVELHEFKTMRHVQKKLPRNP